MRVVVQSAEIYRPRAPLDRSRTVGELDVIHGRSLLASVSEFPWEVPASFLEHHIASATSLKPSSKKVAAKLFILQGDAEPLSSGSVGVETRQLPIGVWLPDLQMPRGKLL